MNFEKLLKPIQLSVQRARFYGKHNKKFLYKDGKKFEGIYYYPRASATPDIQINAAKLFRVQRVKPIKGNPFWEKRLLKELGLDGKQSDFTVVKNIPENNARLWKIKHLINVTPITFPYGEPTVQDVKHTILKENGECIVKKDIGPIEIRETARESFDNQPNRLDTVLLRKDSRLKWLNPW